ncbi:hypothetical protein HT102_03375 [Hoyosella sp. G463]|uniref:Uncharacterized protein n=1 Tax=Lolliginicoccus lacisalsi TaxID=2742202 RepID=A0A927JBB9_9ACTN|nr:hypothetical protein [Lolliginicoccus lacisalsi]MBD8505532.1 hypothetical protein [Lolliginicoccus lacisalsi]
MTHEPELARCPERGCAQRWPATLPTHKRLCFDHGDEFAFVSPTFTRDEPTTQPGDEP